MNRLPFILKQVMLFLIILCFSTVVLFSQVVGQNTYSLESQNQAIYLEKDKLTPSSETQVAAVSVLGEGSFYSRKLEMREGGSKANKSDMTQSGNSMFQTVTVSIPDELEGKTGASVEVPVNVSGGEVNQIFAGSISFSYDAGVINAPSVAAGGLLSSVTENTSVSGQVIFSFAQTVPLSGEGTLVIATFNVVGTAGSITVLDLTDASFNEGAIVATLDDGDFTVLGGGVRGDVTEDGIVNIADLIRVINIILRVGPSPTEAERAAADLNDDGLINVTDLIGIINIILGIG